MAQFWLATCEPGHSLAAADAAATPILAARSPTLAIEVIGDVKLGEYAVLFSTASDKNDPAELGCCIGFANGAQACSVWHDRGFPLVDAQIEYRDKTLFVTSPFFAEPTPTEPTAMKYQDRVFAISGVELAPVASTAGDAKAGLTTRYNQAEQAPDSGLPATLIRRREVVWQPTRSYVRKATTSAVQMDVAPARYPSLAPFATGNLSLVNVWTGALAVPAEPASRAAKTQRASRADTFGQPAFRFDDVEVIGFRLDLDRSEDIDRKLTELIAPLNFHLLPTERGADHFTRNAITDFRYRAATRTVVIELLRYGSMRLKTPVRPLDSNDYQSQHELVVRVLVGRVDDDTAQAHDPATYVPAIFVDNPWSKAVGRDLQGFDKWMASFCVARDNGIARLLPDGRLVDVVAGGAAKVRKVQPLASICQINLVQNTGGEAGKPLLDLDCYKDSYDNWDHFEKIDLDLALGSSSLAVTRWQQSDFSAPEFRRAFAREAVRRTLKGFHSVQVSPVGKRALANAWITGTFTVDDGLRIARPSGVVSISPHNECAAPAGWRTLCDTLGIGAGQSRSISFPTGSWYRLKFSMDLTIDNGLDWTGAA
jgi:hypothetical protein